VGAISELLQQESITHIETYSYMDVRSSSKQAVETEDSAQQVQRIIVEPKDGISSDQELPHSRAEFGEHDDAQKLKRFQSYGAMFYNASDEEKAKMCKDLEAKLAKKLRHGCALSSKLLNRAVAWLTPPESQAQPCKSSQMSELQSKLRSALIRSLECIDLHDQCTQQSLRISLQYLKQMIQQFEEEQQMGVKGAMNGQEWCRIRKLVLGNNAVLPKIDLVSSKLCASLSTEDPKCSFEPDDATPRTNHSYLGECFEPSNVPFVNPSYLASEA
jgi:hypothetical protein